MDHIRGAHDVPWEIKSASLEKYLPPWTVTRKVWSDSFAAQHSGILTDVLLFSDIHLSLVHHYRIHKRSLPHIAFRRNYMSQLRALLPLPAVPPAVGVVSPDSFCSGSLCPVGSPEVMDGSPRTTRCAFRHRRPVQVMEPPVVNIPFLMIQDPLAAAGAVVLDCRRSPLLPVSRDVSGMDLSEFRTPAVMTDVDVLPLEREPLFGGGDLLGLICPELGVTPLVDPGTDVEDERPTPVGSPSPVVDGAVPLSTPLGVDMELVQVFLEVGVLPAMVTPVVVPEGESAMTPAQYPVPPIPELSVVEAASPARPAVGSPARDESLLAQILPSGSVAQVFSSPKSPVLWCMPADSLPSELAAMDQYLPWNASLQVGDSTLLPAPLTPCRMIAGQFASGAGVSSPTGETDVAGGHPRMPDCLGRAPLTFFRIDRILELLHGCSMVCWVVNTA